MRKIDTSNVRIPGTNLQGGRAVAVWALALYALLFIVLNDRKLKVDFVLFSVQSNELLALIVILGLGFAAGFIARGWKRPDGTIVESQAHAIEPEASPAPAPEPAPSAQEDR